MPTLPLLPRRWSAHVRGLAAVLFVFIASRLVYAALGITFVAQTLDDGWQIIDPALLRTRLWESLYHLHSRLPSLTCFWASYSSSFQAKRWGCCRGCSWCWGRSLPWQCTS
jgi:hypothetical protein